MKIFKLVLIAVALVASGTAQAACGFKNSVSLKSLTAGFQAWKSVTSAMAECGNFEPVLDQEFRKKQPVAFSANPALYQIGGVSNGPIHWTAWSPSTDSISSRIS